VTDSVIKILEKDCRTHGRGRKAWWAKKLGVPPLTVSHWLHGRQNPNAQRTILIKEFFDANRNSNRRDKWKQILWDCYYQNVPIAPLILAAIVIEILSLPTIDSRTLALLSHLVERLPNTTETLLPTSDFVLDNRIGWLVETTGLQAAFEPNPFKKSQPLLAIPLSFQTRLGKKWHLIDCPLQPIKEQLL
jgi:hypothetical protein